MSSPEHFSTKGRKRRGGRRPKSSAYTSENQSPAASQQDNTQETKAAEWFAGLSEEDYANVQGYLEALQELADNWHVRVSVLAVGSTTKPTDRRDHDPNDIDLQVLEASKPETLNRRVTARLIREATMAYFEREGWESTMDPVDPRARYGPSFVAKPSPDLPGLPLHVHLPGEHIAAADNAIRESLISPTPGKLIFQRI